MQKSVLESGPAEVNIVFHLLGFAVECFCFVSEVWGFCLFCFIAVLFFNVEYLRI